MIENKKSKRQAIEEKFEEYFSQRVSEKWDGERWVNGTTLKKEWIIKHVCNLSPDSPEQYFQKYNTDSVRTSLTKEGIHNQVEHEQKIQERQILNRFFQKTLKPQLLDVSLANKEKQTESQFQGLDK